MIEILKHYYPSFSHIEESEIFNDGKVVGWHSTLFDLISQIGSGCSVEKEIARRKAVSEAIERGVFRELFRQDPKPYLLDEFPTTSGFAAGFESNSAKLRSIAEAVERWAWSKWIDDNCLVDIAKPSLREIGPLGTFFYKKFDAVLFFRKAFVVTVEKTPIELQFAASIGLKDGGAFPGSRVCSIFENPWEHGLVEAWRHHLLSKPPGLDTIKPGVYKERVRFFSKNRDAALVAVDPNQKYEKWNTPALRLLVKVDAVPKNIFVWRAICADFIGWHLGSESRFVF